MAHPTTGGKSLLVRTDYPPPPGDESDSDSASSCSASSSVSGEDRKEGVAATEIEDDAALIVPLPVIQFVQGHLTPKACGHCAECRKPPCGRCKSCLLNAKATGTGRRKDKHRCKALTCVRLSSSSPLSSSSSSSSAPLAAAPPSVNMTLEEINAELGTVSTRLAAISAKRGSHSFDERMYQGLIERKKTLHKAQVQEKIKKCKRKSVFPTGGYDAWGVIASMERARQKFAKFIVKNSGSEDCRRSLAQKRQMRDELDNMILRFCTRFSELVAPINEEAEFLRLLDVSRDQKQ